MKTPLFCSAARAGALCKKGDYIDLSVGLFRAVNRLTL